MFPCVKAHLKGAACRVRTWNARPSHMITSTCGRNFGTVSVTPLGVPSLMTTKLPQSSPLGLPTTYSISDEMLWIFLFLGLSLGGLLVGGIYLGLIAQQVRDGAPNLPRLLDLGADKCVPCKMMAPILEELRVEYAGRFEVVFVDVWKNPTAAKPYELRVIPTQIFFAADGTELFRHEGFYGKDDILGKWRELGIDLGTPDATGEG